MYVIRFDNRWTNSENVSWYNSTFWIDTDSGAVVESKTNYPTPFDHTLDELKNGVKPGQTKAEDAVVAHNATVVFSYENLSANEELPAGTFAPPKNATRTER